ncbi:MAG: restriction endonuclease [Gammaproteobacteria bacterium]
MTEKTKPFFKDILRVLQGMGGKAKAAEVIERIMKERNITEADYGEFETKTASGSESVKNPIRWGRQRLVYLGYLREDSAYGYWELSGKGRDADIESVDSEKMMRESNQMIAEKRQQRDRSGRDALSGVQSSDLLRSAEPQLEADNAESRTPPSDEDQLREALLAKLRDLSPGGFERICARLVREMGFEDVEGTPLSRDGGIDGFGVLVLNPLAKRRFVYQCKRYTDASVGDAAVRDFESAARRRRAEMGAIITTSAFTKAAKDHVAGSNFPVELIDGEALVGLFVKYELGVKAKRIIEVDDHFFVQYKDKDEK